MSLLCVLLPGLSEGVLFESINLFSLKYLIINLNLSETGRRTFKNVGHYIFLCFYMFNIFK